MRIASSLHALSPCLLATLALGCAVEPGPAPTSAPFPGSPARLDDRPPRDAGATDDACIAVARRAALLVQRRTSDDHAPTATTIVREEGGIMTLRVEAGDDDYDAAAYLVAVVPRPGGECLAVGVQAVPAFVDLSNTLRHPDVPEGKLVARHCVDAAAAVANRLESTLGLGASIDPAADAPLLATARRPGPLQSSDIVFLLTVLGDDAETRDYYVVSASWSGVTGCIVRGLARASAGVSLVR